jgi:hypothetical protein
MAGTEQKQRVDRNAIYRDVLDILTEITMDWDVGEISAETQLGSIVLESISLVYLIGDLQQNHGLQDRLLQKLRTAKIKLTDLRVTDVVDFVCDIKATQEVDVEGGQV